MPHKLSLAMERVPDHCELCNAICTLFLLENPYYIKAGGFVSVVSPNRLGETTVGKLEDKLAEVAEGGGCAMKGHGLNGADVLGLHLDLGLQPG